MSRLHNKCLAIVQSDKAFLTQSGWSALGFFTATPSLTGGLRADGYYANTVSKPGRISKAFHQVFEKNIFITPGAVDLGLAAPGDSQKFELWHSYPNSNYLNFVQETGDGVDLVGTRSGNITSFQSVIFESFLNQKNDGDVSYRASFSFADGQGVFDLKAMLAMVLADGIDWSSSPVITHQYMTEIIESYNGSEQRISWREVPRVSYSYQYSFDGQRAYEFENTIFNLPSKLIVPAWPYAVNVSAAPRAGDEVVYLASINDQVRAAKTLIISDGSISESVKVKTITGLAVTLFSLVKLNYKESATLAPAFPAVTSDETNAVSITSDFDQHGITFELDETTVTLPVPVDDFPLLDGKRILDIRPDRSKDVSVEIARKREHFDPQIGARKIYNRTQGVVRHFNYSYRFFSEKDRQRFEDFCSLNAGAQGEFYTHGPGQVFELSESILTPSANITIKKSGYSSFNKSNSFAPAVAIRMYNGITHYRKIISAEKLENGNEYLALNEPLPVINLDDIEVIIPLYLSRFASDTFTYTFDTTQDSSITKTIKQLLHADPATN